MIHNFFTGNLSAGDELHVSNYYNRNRCCRFRMNTHDIVRNNNNQKIKLSKTVTRTTV